MRYEDVQDMYDHPRPDDHAGRAMFWRGYFLALLTVAGIVVVMYV